MDTSTRPNRFTLIARIAAIVVAFVFAHDAVMALDPHGSASQSHHAVESDDAFHPLADHDTPPADDCGPDTGVVSSPLAPIHPAATLPGNVVEVRWREMPPLLMSHPVWVQNAADVRVWFQIFLN